MSDYWNDYDQEVQERAGGGIVGKGLVDLVWKTFPSGVEQEKTIFPTVPCHKNSPPEVKKKDKAAQEAARAFGAEHGHYGQPQKGLLIRMYRDHSTTRGQPATWKTDRFFFKADWTDAGKKVKESVRESGITRLPWEGYMRLGFFDDPYHVSLGEAGMKETDQDGNPRYPQVAYVIEVFANEEAARAALGTPATEPSSVAGVTVIVPNDDWTPESWHSVWGELHKAHHTEGKSLADLAKEYGVTPIDIKRAIDGYIPY